MCAAAQVVGPLLLLVYVSVATILLVNLLIAQMADTYTMVATSSYTQWQFSRVALILECADRRRQPQHQRQPRDGSRSRNAHSHAPPQPPRVCP